VSVGSQNNLGSGEVTVNYGGSLLFSGLFTPTNIITVNAGGTLNALSNVHGVYGSAPGTLIVRSMATLAEVSNTEFRVTGNTFPAAGVLIGANNGNRLFIGDRDGSYINSQPYPILTGTMVFNQVGPNAANGFFFGPLNTGTAPTIAFNNSVPLVSGINFNGTTLGGDLTLAGSGNTGLTGLVPTGAAGVLGTVSGNHAVTVNMAPTGAVSLTDHATTKLTTLTVNSGTAIVSTDLGSNTAQLNGGGIRMGTAISSAINVGANGGVLETASALSYTGNLTATAGASNLVLRSAGGALTIATGTNTGLNAGITLATAGTPRSVYFNGTATQLPNAAYNITIPAGISFGGTAVNTSAYTNKGRFVLQSGTTDAVYDIDAHDTSPNLSDTGLDKDVWIGLSGTALAASGYTLRTTGSYQNDYRVVPIATTTQNNTVFTGAGKNLIVSTGVVPTDVNSSATDVLGSGFALTITAAQNYTGSTTVQGTVKNALMGGGVSGPTLGIGALGDLSGTTGITLDKSATMITSGGPANYGRITAANVPITVKGGAMLTDGSLNNNENIGVTDRIVTSADLTLGGDTGGGAFRMAFPVSGIHAQTLDALTVNAGYSAITSINSGSTANLTFSGGAKVTRSTGGVLAIATVTNYNIAFTAAPNATGMVSGGTYPILIGVVRGPSVGGGIQPTEWVAAGAGGLASTTYVNNDYSSANNNVDATASANIAAGSTINSLRSIATATLTLAGNLTINSGGILMDPGAGNKTYSITGGTLRSGVDELIIFGNYGAGNALTISSQITGANPQNITLAGDNTRTTVTLSNASNSVGNIYIYGGTLISSVAGALTTGSTDTIYMFGGFLSFPNSTTQDYAGRKLVVGPAGSTYIDGGTAAVSSLGGAVTLNGNLNVTGLGNKTLSGNIGTALGIEGGGQGTITAQTNAGRLTLSGNNQYWTGGLRVGNGMQVRLNHANAAGSGPLVNHGAIGIIEFTSNFGTSLANDVIGSVSTSETLISNAKTDAAVTLSGRIYSVGGLTFQGYDNAGAVSETVLSGTLSISGIPDIYSYGDTSNLQRFVNGQGGINSGITKYQTTTALTYGTAGFLAYAGGTTTAVENGAEGYVRFSGANSFIPGAVGPGYLAALRKGGASALNYGYLLTAGSTYRLPQGKSFVLGTLGSGTAQVGTLGATGSGTANLDGGTKHEASTGQLLAGLYGGDINIHGNASGDTGSLKLLTRDADTTLVLGNTSQVVFTPTWGDSGGQSCMTLMRHRSGNTTLRKTGLGTLVVKNTAYNQVSGVDARGTFTWQVDAGTLRYDQVDTGTDADYLGFNVNSTATLAGSGTIKASVSVVSGTLNPGSATSPAALTMKSLTLNDSSAVVALDLAGDTAGTQYDQLVIPSGGDGVFLNNATLAIVLSYSPAVGKVFTIIDRQSAGAVTGVFNGLAEGATVASTGITRNFTISYVGGDGNDVTLTAQ
jgi:hypothetical protein